MSFTFSLGGVTHIVMVRKVPWKSQVAVLMDGEEWQYEVDAPGIVLLPGKSQPPAPALEEKILQMLKLYFAPVQ